jgi:hypothetical protein
MHPAGGVEPLLRYRPLRRVLVSGTRFVAPHAGVYRAHARPRRLGCAGASSARRPTQVRGPAGSGGLAGAYNCRRVCGSGRGRPGYPAGRWRRAGRMGGRVVDGLGHRCGTAGVQAAAGCNGEQMYDIAAASSPCRQHPKLCPCRRRKARCSCGARPAGSAPALTARHRCGELRDAAMPGRLLEGVTEPEHRRFVVWLCHELEPDRQPVVREARGYGHGGHPGLRGD